MITKALCTLKYKTGRLKKADVRRLHISCRYLSFKSIKCKNLKLGGGHLDQLPGGVVLVLQAFCVLSHVHAGEIPEMSDTPS